MLSNNPQNIQWQQTMLRIKNPAQTIPFYEDAFGMKLIHEYNFDSMGFSLYFMGTPIPNIVYPSVGTTESEQLLWNYPSVTLEFTHNHDSNEDTIINNGNIEPHRGFGHIAFNTDDVYASYDKLSTKGVKFQKAPNEGRMKGLSFALDPNGYWIEICQRNKNLKFGKELEYNLSQTMIRVKDPLNSLDFYTNKLGMTQVAEAHIENGQFSVYFLSSHISKSEVENKSMDERWQYMKESFHPFLELTHNWNTEKDEGFAYHDGNQEPKGFGHIGFLTDDLDKTCDDLQQQKVPFRKLPNEGKIRGIAFAMDPDGYWVELIQRGCKF